LYEYAVWTNAANIYSAEDNASNVTSNSSVNPPLMLGFKFQLQLREGSTFTLK